MPAQAQERPARAGPLRGVAALLGGALLLAALLILGRELIAAQVPQHRAALEDFIRQETGLEITFSRLSVRWGWYGPEAVFDSAALGEPDSQAVLRAAQVVVVVDPWRSMRSGQLEAGRIRLINPEIDLSAAAGDAAALTGGRRGTSPGALADAPRWLARWRGGRIDIENGALRWPAAPGAQPLTLSVRRAQLRRLGAEWSAEAHLQLPDSLGATAEFATRFSGDIARPESLSGTLSLSGERLNFEGWRHVASTSAVALYVPRRGAGSLQLQGAFRAGRFYRLAGDLQAQSLEWAPRAAPDVPLALPVLNARWQLTPAGAGWHLSAQSLELGPALRGTAQLSFDAHAARATLADLPAGALAALTRWWAPQAPLAQLALSGRARTLEIDWDARRPAGERWLAAADLDGLTLASAAGDVTLSGLSAHLRAQEAQLTGELTGQAARLVARGEAPLTLEDLRLQGHLAAALEGTGWRLSSEDFELSAGAAHIDGRIALDATAGASTAARGPRAAARDRCPDPRGAAGPGRAARARPGRHAPHRRTHRERGVRAARRAQPAGRVPRRRRFARHARAARRRAGRRRCLARARGARRAHRLARHAGARERHRRAQRRARARGRAGAVGRPWPARAARQRAPGGRCPAGARVAA